MVEEGDEEFHYHLELSCTAHPVVVPTNPSPLSFPGNKTGHNPDGTVSRQCEFTVEAKGSEQQKGWTVMDTVVFHPRPLRLNPHPSVAGNIACSWLRPESLFGNFPWPQETSSSRSRPSHRTICSH